MAARVNVRFVAILCTVVGVVFVGMAGAAYFIVKKSASDHYATGQEYLQAANYAEAERAFSKAVNKERTNTVYLETWIDTIERLTPETQTKFGDMYWKEYVPAMRQLAVAKRTDVDAWERYLQTQYEQRKVFGAQGRTGWQALLTETNTALDYFLNSPEAANDDAQWHRLKRYRALSNLNMMAQTGKADEVTEDKTVLDFEAALRIDPSDDESAIGLYEWLMAKADQAEGTRDDPQQYLDRAGRVLDAFLAENPGHPRSLIARLFYDLQVQARPLRGLRTQEERVRANVALTQEFAPRVAETVERVLTEGDASEVDVQVAQLVNRLERLVDRQSEIPLTKRVIQAAREANAQNPGQIAQLDFFQGVFMAEAGQHEGAIDAFEAVLDAPDVPVSLDGIILTMLRGQAALRRTESAIDLLAQADETEAPAIRERLTDYREVVDTYFPQGTPSVLLLDARIALTNGQLADAQRLAVSYQRESGGNDPEASFLLGSIYMQRNQPGQALEELERFVELSPNIPAAWAQLSSLRDRLGDRAGALEAIERAAGLAPDDPNIQRRFQAMQAWLGEGLSDDPVTQALVRVDRFIDTTGGVSPRYDRAIDVVDAALRDHGDDARLYNALVRLYGMKGDNELALETVDRAIALYPDDQALRQMRASLRFREGEIPPEIQGVRRTMLQYRQAINDGREADAERFLEQARTQDPDDPELLQVLIARALVAEDYSEGRRLVDRATELNIDQAGGRILRADLLEAEGRGEEALSMIDSVIADGLTSVPVLYRRARILRTMNRIEDAVQVYEDLLRRQPDSVANVRQVVAALTELGRTRRALEIARRSQRVAGTDPVFVNQWLSLEAEVGDATAAMLKREEIRGRDPENDRNNLALAGVYVRLGEWAKARPIIDALRQKDDNISLVMLDARWHAEQGQVGRGISTFEQYLAGRQQSGALDVVDVLSYANFLQVQNQTKQAIDMLRGSTNIDDPQTQPIRRRLALLLLSGGRADEAVPVIDELIAAGSDTDGVLELARVEAFIRAGMVDEARQALENLSPRAQATEAAGILRADLALRAGDRRAAEEALSNTLASHPTSAQAYTRLAQMRWNDVQRDEDLTPAERNQWVRNATADLNEAIKHEPNAWEAHRLLGVMAMDAGRYDDAARHIERTIQIQPGQAPLRTSLVRRMVEAGDAPQAMTVIDRAIEANPADIDLQVRFARLMADLSRPTEAMRLFENALQRRRNPEIAGQYVEFLLDRDTAQDRAKARQVLSDPNLGVRDSWQLQLMQAALLLQDGNRAGAIARARESFNQARPDPTSVIRWFNVLPALIKEHPVRMEIALQIGVENTPGRVGEIMLASLMLQDPSTEQRGFSELRLLAQDRDEIVAVRSGQLLGDTLYGRGEYEAAAEAWRGVLEASPDEAQSLNNLAFVLATELGDCRQAIELSSRAREIGVVAPAIVLSTLAVAHLECGEIDQAQRVVEELTSISRSTPEEALAALRRAQLALAQSETQRAQDELQRAELLIEAWGGRAESYRSILEELRAEAG